METCKGCKYEHSKKPIIIACFCGICKRGIKIGMTVDYYQKEDTEVKK